MQIFSRMDLDKEIAWVTKIEDELAKSWSCHSSYSSFPGAHRAGIELPATATNSSPIEELRHLAVGALVRGATVHTSPSSASIMTDVEVMTLLKELMAKVDKCTALQTRVNDLERASSSCPASSRTSRKATSSKLSRSRPCSGSWQYKQATPSASCRARCHCHLGHGGERDGDRDHRAGIRDHPRHHGAAERDSGVSRQTGQAASSRGPPKEAAGQAGVPEASCGSPDIRQTPQPAQH